MTATIEISDLVRRYGDKRALDGVSLTVEAGAYCVLLGPSGCGKTTLLNAIGGFIDPTTGNLRIGGANMVGVPAAQRPTTTVFQDYALFPHMSLLDNVAFGLRMRGIGRAARHGKAQDMLALVGLEAAGNARPSELSGGQRQRVALARALAVEPDVLLLDEPLGALDLNLRRAMQDELKAIQRSVGSTFVHVTHDQEEAMAIADLLVVMNAGRIEDQGTPERVYRQPATRFAASFLGEMNFVPATVREGTVSTRLGSFGQTSLSGDLTLCLRPEAIGTAPTDYPIGRGTVERIVFQGRHLKATLSLDGFLVTALLPVSAAVSIGDQIPLFAEANQITFLEGGLS